MKRKFPITVYVSDRRATVLGDDEHGYGIGSPRDGWKLLGTYFTPEDLGAALLEWAVVVDWS